MGCFSWMFSDTNNEENLVIGEEAYVVLPDGSMIYEPVYDGYGNFGGRDIYEMVVDWNKEDLLLHNFNIGFIKEETAKMFMDYGRGAVTEEELIKYNKDWKRIFGIAISCEDKYNRKLRFPIIICKRKHDKWFNSKLEPSKGDPNQGFCKVWDTDDDDELY